MNMVDHAPMAAQPKMLKHSLKKKPAPAGAGHSSGGHHHPPGNGNSKWPAARQQQQQPKQKPPPLKGSHDGASSEQLKGRRPSSVVTSIDWREHEEKRKKREQEERQLQKQREQERFRKEEKKRMEKKQKKQMQKQIQHQNHNNMRGLAPSPADVDQTSSSFSVSESDDPAKPRIRRPSSVVTSMDWRSKQQNQNGDEPSQRSSFSTSASNSRAPSPNKMMMGGGGGHGHGHGGDGGRRTSKSSVRSATPSEGASSRNDKDDDERPLTSSDAVALVLKRLRENGKAHLGEDAPLTPPPSPKKSQANKKQPLRNGAVVKTPQSQSHSQPKAQQQQQQQQRRAPDNERRQPPSPPAPTRTVQKAPHSPLPGNFKRRSTSGGVDGNGDDLDDSSLGAESYEDEVVHKNRERALSSDEAVQLVIQRMRSDPSMKVDADDESDDEDNELVDSGHARPQPQYLAKNGGAGGNKTQPPAGSSNAFWKTLQEAKERQDAIRDRVRRYSSDDDEAHNFGSNSSAFQSPSSSRGGSGRLRDSHANKVPYDRHHQLDCDPSLMFAEDRHMFDSRAWERLNQLSTSASGSSSGSGYYKQVQQPPAYTQPKRHTASAPVYTYQPLSAGVQYAASNSSSPRRPEKVPSVASTPSSSTSRRSLDDMPAGGHDSTRSLETAFFDAEEDDEYEDYVAPLEEPIHKPPVRSVAKAVPPPPPKKVEMAPPVDEPESSEEEEEEEEIASVHNEEHEENAASSGWGFTSMLGTVSSGTSILGQALSTSVSMASSTAASASTMISTTITSRVGSSDEDDVDGDHGDGGDGEDYANRRKPKHPPKNTKIASRELEIIRKCQEQVKVREQEEIEKRANAAKLDEENIRLQREEEAARAIVTREVQAYRAMMMDMGEGDKLAPEDAEKAAQEYDDRLAMADTLQEQEAKAKAAQEQMAQVDEAAKPDDDEEGSEGEYSYEAEGCCCVVM